MIVMKTEDYHEDMGAQIFISFNREDDGTMVGEPFDVKMCNGYMDDNFDEKEWTHFLFVESYNFVFEAIEKEILTNHKE